MSDQALKFIGGVFFGYDIPKERLYLFRYFKTDIEKAFLRYYYCFGEFEFFTEHTGWFCQKRWLRLLLKKHDRIVELHDKAKKEMDFTLLARIESGKHKKI